jgi:hypothetical protein
MGSYAMVKHPEEFTIVETMLPTGNHLRASSDCPGLAQMPIRQGWSVGGLTDEAKAEMERLLK